MSNYTRLDLLRTMLTYRRPMGSDSERAFIRRYIACLPGAEMDACGNWHVQVGSDPSLVWSAHTDTVHSRAGRQHVQYDGRYLSIGQRTQRKSNCLGADDGAGCFLLHQMIGAGIPGHYVFHYGEERGGIGSSGIVAHAPDLFLGARAVIAFDRRGTSDVITHQMCGRCSSDLFAESVAAALNRAGLEYRPADTGVFTDSANYVDIVGECINLSVGYANEHRPTETLDTWHLFALLDALVEADWTALQYQRQPGEYDPADRWDYGPVFLPSTADPMTCEQCTRAYTAVQSDAWDWYAYCSERCEDAARSTRVLRYRGAFLSEEYAHVVEAGCTCLHEDLDGIDAYDPDCPVHLECRT